MAMTEPEAGGAVIAVEGLTKRYRQHLAVDHVRFEVQEEMAPPLR